MLHFKYATLLLAAAIIFSSCKKKSSDEETPASPVAGFGNSLSCPYVPATATFTNVSTNATSYSWNFGDGNTSTETNPSHTYTVAGDYTVTLTATANGESNTVSTTLHILASHSIAKIAFIWLTQYPLLDSSSAPWDVSDGPDIYFKVYRNDTSNVVLTTAVSNNVTAPPVTMNITPAYQVLSLNDIMYVAAFDKEMIGPDTVMGKRVAPLVGFRMSDYTCTYPSTINIASANDSLKFTIGITWQ